MLVHHGSDQPSGNSAHTGGAGQQGLPVPSMRQRAESARPAHRRHRELSAQGHDAMVQNGNVPYTHNRCKFTGESTFNYSGSTMKSREVTLPAGQRFQVPQGIQRIDSSSTHGWQVRYQGTKLFSDGESHDPRLSLINAVSELLARLSATPTYTALKQTSSTSKTSDLPPGISGPIVRNRLNRSPTASLSVLLPRFGGKAEIRTVYIGTPNTYTVDGYLAALEKSVTWRRAAVERYEQEAHKAHLAAQAFLRAELKALRADQA